MGAVVDFDAIIVGYGPVGAMAANLLGKRGWSVAVVDRLTDVYPKPRAIAMDGEICRVLQEIGLAETVLAECAEGLGAEFVDAKRKRIEGFDLPPGHRGAQGWPDLNFFHQPLFERQLRAHGEEAYGVTTYLGYEAALPEQAGEEVRLQIAPVSGETGGDKLTLKAPFLIAADGASSPIRKHLGITFNSLGYDCDWLVVDLHLTRDVTLPPITQQICDPARRVTFVPGTAGRPRWEFQLNDGESWDEMLEERRIWSLLAPWVTPETAEIARAAVYQFHAATARKWQEGRIFLVGDAAHQTPPFLGQGMCAGIRDVANLTWKLDFVKRGLAPARLLETYEQERHPHALDLIDHAVAMGKLIDSLADAQVTGNWPENMDAVYGGSRGFPHLHGGVLSLSEAEPSDGVTGFLMPQPRVRLNGGMADNLDAFCGTSFAIIAARDVREELDDGERAFLEQIGAEVIALPDAARETAELDGLLAQHDAVIVRPDHYVFGVVNEAHPLSAELAKLRRHFC